MISLSIAIVLLILGYFVYGSIVERVFGIKPDRKPPAYAQQDGVDYVPMPTWKVFMIQFLNIAGLGPIFGAIMGAKFGMSAYLWIVVGCIFGGAVHDYLSGMLSIRSNGASLPEIVGDNLGTGVKQTMRVFTVLLMILVGAVFVAGPAGLLATFTMGKLSVLFWTIVIFAYYLLATLLPIDKVIGKVYPLFAFALIFMAIGILISLYFYRIPLPEITDGISNIHPNKEQLPIFPMLFISIACGAVSGFHATQSPLMARCVVNERKGRFVFYGAMIMEGIVALIWAAAAIYFFSPEGQSVFGVTSEKADLVNGNAATVVDIITKKWLGMVGGVLAILGVIAAPISSGDTAFRSARLIVSDIFHIEQKKIKKRLYISIPLFVVAIIILQLDFNVIWRYFAWANQTLSVFTFWALTVWLAKNKKNYYLTLLPGMFMTMVCSTYIVIAPEGFSLPYSYGIIFGFLVVVLLTGLFFKYKRNLNQSIQLNNR